MALYSKSIYSPNDIVLYQSSLRRFSCCPPTTVNIEMLGFFIFVTFVQCCFCSDWSHDSYLDAYAESEGTVYEGPYPHFSRTPMKNQTVSMMPFLLQLVLIIAKLMLKFTIFKIIVKFVAVICLFLFIPTLRMPKAREARKSDNKAWETLSQETENSTLHSLTVLVKEAITKHQDKLS